MLKTCGKNPQKQMQYIMYICFLEDDAVVGDQRMLGKEVELRWGRLWIKEMEMEGFPQGAGLTQVLFIYPSVSVQGLKNTRLLFFISTKGCHCSFTICLVFFRKAYY